MAKAESEKASVTIPLNVWFDPNTKRIHLTHNGKAGEPDISTNCPPGSPMERQFARLLAHRGKPTPP
jgi:hypothetical protein